MASTPEKVRQLQRKLYQASKQKEGYRFYSLYDKLYRADILQTAYAQCRANAGAAGVDGVTFEAIERQGVESFLASIAQRLKTHRYTPAPVRRVMIPKPNGKERPLGIATLQDRVVQTACKLVLEPIIEPHLHPGSYGYRPQRRAQEAVWAIEGSLQEGYRQVYDADLSAYFDTIPQDRLMAKLARHVSDQNLLALIGRFLQAPIEREQEGKRVRMANPQGVPQGAVISPLLANLYLNDFCRLIDQRTPCRIITYADDFVILARQAFTQEQQTWLADTLAQEGLKINEEKTGVVDMSIRGASFDFLGFRFQRIRGYYGRGKEYIKVQPSPKSQQRFKERIRQMVKHRTPLTLRELIERVNRFIRGWRNYFREVGYPRQVFFKLDWFVCARFYRWARRLSQRGSRCLAPDAWEVLRKAGLVFLQPVVRPAVKGAR